MLYIITGGSGSGKSEYAEQTAVQCRNGNWRDTLVSGDDADLG